MFNVYKSQIKLSLDSDASREQSPPTSREPYRTMQNTHKAKARQPSSLIYSSVFNLAIRYGVIINR